MKRIVIAGATSGIGLEVAQLCIRAGWRVGAAGRRQEALEALRAEAPGQVETQTIDITRDDAPERLGQLIERLGGMDIYFHASGIGSRNTALRPDIELNTLRTNGEGFVRMVTAAFGYFRSHGGGRIAVISSIAGTKGLGSAPPTRRPNGCRTPTSTHWRNSPEWKVTASALRTSARDSSQRRCSPATAATRC